MAQITETGTIDLKSQKAGHDDAATKATNYIAADSTGIRIANANPSTAMTYQHQTATETEFVVDGTSMAEFGGSGARIGASDGLHQVLTGESTSFMYGDDAVAYVSTDKFYAMNAEVEDAFYIGDYSIRNASDGSLVIGLRR